MTINQGYFTVSIGTFSGGTVSADYAAAFPGTTITVTVSPAQGYQLKSGSLQVLQTSDDTSVPLTETGTAYTFTMPPADIQVSAAFEPLPPDIYSITIDELDGGTISADPGEAEEGIVITVTVTPDEGYVLRDGSLRVLQAGDDASVPLTETGTAYTFTMPAAHVTVSAEFIPTSFGIIIEGPQDKTIGLTITRNGVPVPAVAAAPVELSFSAGDSLTVTVEPGYTVGGGNLLWVLENLPSNISGSSLTVDAKKYALKLYTLTVMIKEEGQWYSTNIAFKVVE
jgi:hypothetical protein